MASYTARDIITLALQDCGAFGLGQTPTGEDINNALTRLNWMIQQWQKKRWLVWRLLDLSVVSTGAQTYSIGPSAANINLSYRPDKLEFAYFRLTTQSQPSQVDYPLELIQSREDYSRIALKQLTAFPQYMFYDPALPNGFLYPWPLPQASIYELHVLVKEAFAPFASLTTTVVLPDETYAALFYNLQVRLCAAYRIPPQPALVALAKDSLQTLRSANYAIARLQVDTSLIRPGIYNPYSDIIR